MTKQQKIEFELKIAEEALEFECKSDGMKYWLKKTHKSIPTFYRRAREVISKKNTVKDCKALGKINNIINEDAENSQSSEKSEFDQAFDELNEIIKEHGNAGDTIIGLSATPFQMWAAENVFKVRCRLPPNYCGYNWFMGEKIDDEVDCLPPRTFSYAEFDKMAGTNLKEFCLRLYRKNREGNPPKAFLMDFPGVDHDEYREMCERDIAKAINYCLITNPLGFNGMLFRWINNNDVCYEMVEKLKYFDLDKRIIVDCFTMKNNPDGRCFKDWLKKRGHDGSKPTLIMATGSLRMGDNPPIWFKYAFDTTRESGYTALLQGSRSRLFGVGKNNPLPICIMSPENKKLIEDYENNNGTPSKNPHPHTDIGGKINAGKPAISCTIGRDIVMKLEKQHPVRKMWDKADEWTGKQLGVYNHESHVPIFNWLTPAIWDVLVNENLLNNKYVEKPDLLYPYQEDKDGYKYQCNASGVKVGFRRAGGIASANGNLRSDRFVPGGELNFKEENKTRLEVQWHVFKNENKLQLIAIRLRLRKGCKTYRDSNTPELSNKPFTTAYNLK